MADNVDITFDMTVDDLEFLVFAMKFLEGGIEQETLRGYWQTVFERMLDKEFPVPEFAGLRITVEFLGGFRDGERLVNDYTNPRAHKQAMEYAQLSDGGKIGYLLEVGPDAAEVEAGEKKAVRTEAKRAYEVFEKIERAGELIFRFRYAGPASEQG
jgi:hypothetical protein